MGARVERHCALIGSACLVNAGRVLAQYRAQRCPGLGVRWCEFERALDRLTCCPEIAFWVDAAAIGNRLGIGQRQGRPSARQFRVDLDGAALSGTMLDGVLEPMACALTAMTSYTASWRRSCRCPEFNSAIPAIHAKRRET